jgi:CRISPR system Cascade subunit CasC
MFGGVRRARVSSQSWKKAMRDYFVNHFGEDQFGIRTLNMPYLIAQELVNRRPDVYQEGVDDDVLDVAETAITASKIQIDKKKHKTKALFFVSRAQIEATASIILKEGYDPKDNTTKKLLRAALNTDHAIDMALFGRMVADDPIFNIDAASQVGQAIGVSKQNPEFDYYTAVDDYSLEDHAGAGMLGTIEYNSSTFYRYANIGMTQLEQNLGSKNASIDAVAKFAESFIESLPSGKQNTFAAQSLPSAILVEIRDTRPVSYAGAFEKPVTSSTDHSIVDNAKAALVDYAQSIRGAYNLYPVKSFVVYLHDDGFSSLGDPSNIKELEDHITSSLHDLIGYDEEPSEEGE